MKVLKLTERAKFEIEYYLFMKLFVKKLMRKELKL